MPATLIPSRPIFRSEIAAILISLAILPVCLTRSSAPTFAEAASLPLRRLFAASPLGVVGAGITGLLLGAFYGLAAIYARRLGLSLAQTATFMKNGRAHV